MSDQGKLILITDIIEQKVRKEKELEFYLRELEKLNSKISYLRTEVDLTNTIIGMIKGEMVYDIKEQKKITTQTLIKKYLRVMV